MGVCGDALSGVTESHKEPATLLKIPSQPSSVYFTGTIDTAAVSDS